ncbi:MAG TPA: sigma-70 family RNA polymerase sigma factor [Ideonella sp.]|nr:sigma-70 family RNA polymerase sigma factor [Ideonella sp.]
MPAPTPLESAAEDTAAPAPGPASRPGGLADASDAELVALCREGRQSAWVALVRRFQRLVYTVPRRAGLSEEQAADVFQLCFATLHEQLARLQQPERVQAWLVTTARRETLRLIELSRRTVSTTVAGIDADGESRSEDLCDGLPGPDPLPDDQLERLQMQHRVRRALQQLEPRSRELVECLFLRDPPLSYEEVAERLQISPGSVGPTRARCLEKLRVLLNELA